MLIRDPLKGGTGRGSRGLEANHRKAHHGHVVGEGLLLRTKDPLLDLPTWEAAGRERGMHTAAPCQPSPERTLAHPRAGSADCCGMPFLGKLIPEISAGPDQMASL